MKKLVVVVLLLIPLTSCDTLKAMSKTGGTSAVGALIGSLLGLPGTIVGAFLGGGVGGMWSENDTLRDQVTKAEAARDRAVADRDTQWAVINDIKKRIDQIPGAPAADPNLPLPHYGPDLEPVPVWYRMTPWQWLKHKFKEGL